MHRTSTLHTCIHGDATPVRSPIQRSNAEKRERAAQNKRSARRARTLYSARDSRMTYPKLARRTSISYSARASRTAYEQIVRCAKTQRDTRRYRTRRKNRLHSRRGFESSRSREFSDLLTLRRFVAAAAAPPAPVRSDHRRVEHYDCDPCPTLRSLRRFRRRRRRRS